MKKYTQSVTPMQEALNISLKTHEKLVSDIAKCVEKNWDKTSKQDIAEALLHVAELVKSKNSSINDVKSLIV